MKNFNENFRRAIGALDARSDHFDGVNAIYRLAACVPIPKGSSLDGIRRQLKRLIKDLEKLDVRANRINIWDEFFEVDFYSKGYQMAMTRGQFAGLQLEFADSLNRSPIQDIYIQDGCFGDDPDDSVKSVSNDRVNFFPEFNSKCFGAEHNEPIEITNFTLLEEYKEVV